MYNSKSYDKFGRALVTELLSIAEGNEPSDSIKYSVFEQVKRAAQSMFLFYMNRPQLNAINERVWDTVKNLDEQMESIARGIITIKTSDGQEAHIMAEDVAGAFADLCKECNIRWYCPSEKGKKVHALGQDWENTDLGAINERAIDRSMFASALKERDLIIYN